MKIIETVLYIAAVVLMALNFLFDLPAVGKVGYGLLFVSFAISFAFKKIWAKKDSGLPG
ncbi:MAG: hypothetical protein IKM02_07185 [Clostridia bacterium]|nr:hypothetical protein [Clostridia bacterium]